MIIRNALVIDLEAAMFFFDCVAGESVDVCWFVSDSDGGPTMRDSYKSQALQHQQAGFGVNRRITSTA